MIQHTVSCGSASVVFLADLAADFKAIEQHYGSIHNNLNQLLCLKSPLTLSDLQLLQQYAVSACSLWGHYGFDLLQSLRKFNGSGKINYKSKTRWFTRARTEEPLHCVLTNLYGSPKIYSAVSTNGSGRYQCCLYGTAGAADCVVIEYWNQLVLAISDVGTYEQSNKVMLDTVHRALRNGVAYELQN